MQARKAFCLAGKRMVGSGFFKEIERGFNLDESARVVLVTLYAL